MKVEKTKMNKKAGGSKDFGKRGNFSKKPGAAPKRSDRPDRPDRPARTDRPARGPKTDRPERQDRPDRTDRPARGPQSDRPARRDQSGGGAKSNGFGRPDRPARGPRTDRFERPDRSDRPERPSERPDRSDRPLKDGKPGNPGRYEHKGPRDNADRKDYRGGKGPRDGAGRKDYRGGKGSKDGAERKDYKGRKDHKEFSDRSPEQPRRDPPVRPPQSDWKKRPPQQVERPSGDRDRDREPVGSPADDEHLVIKGRHEVVQALESGQNIEAVVISTAVKGPVGGQLRELAVSRQIPVKEMNPDLFERKFGAKSQGVAALAGAFDYCSLEELVARVKADRKVLVALNHVEDPRNLGAIVRTVEASGCGGVIIPKHRAAGMTEWAIRTAQGAASYLPVARVNNMGSALEQLKEMGYWIVGLEGKADKRYDEVMYNNDVVIVAGGEDAGLGERIQRVCDDVVAIPLIGKTPSLNVSVSTAVVLYEILRQRRFFQK